MKTLVTSILVFGLGVFLYYKVKGAPEAKQQVSDQIILAVIPAFLFFVCLFLYNFIRAPYLIYVAEFNSAQERINAAELATKSGQDKIRDLEGKLSQQSNKVDSGTAKDSEIARLRAELDDRNRRKTMREQLSVFKTQGEKLRERCRTDAIESALEADAENWFSAVQNYLRQNLDASYANQFVSTRITLFTPNGVLEKRVPLWHGLNQRVETLDKFIDLLR